MKKYALGNVMALAAEKNRSHSFSSKTNGLLLQSVLVAAAKSNQNTSKGLGIEDRQNFVS